MRRWITYKLLKYIISLIRIRAVVCKSIAIEKMTIIICMMNVNLIY